MIRSLGIYESDSYDPHYNLATEKLLMDHLEPGQCILYLWQNQNTVVIGRNQNPWTECRTSLLEAEGCKLARRLSGGGAVFHDLGNLNFTLLMNREDYDLDRQLTVIQTACAMAGIPAERSGRNDLLAQGGKFSGNAFYQDKLHAYHHGTLLINADMDKLQRYLSPSKAKLEAKGICSVRSRVINLKELSPALTCDSMKTYMIAAFEKVYGATSVPISLSDATAVKKLEQQYSSWEYLYGTPLPFTLQCEKHFLWGGFLLQLQAKDGIIKAAKVYSDAMDWNLPRAVEQALTGCRFDMAQLEAALLDAITDKQVARDICNLLKEQV